MRLIFWLCVFFGLYFWAVKTENEELILEKGRALYRTFSGWFEDIEIDFHVKEKKGSHHKQQRSRRWD